MLLLNVDVTPLDIGDCLLLLVVAFGCCFFVGDGLVLLCLSFFSLSVVFRCWRWPVARCLSFCHWR